MTAPSFLFPRHQKSTPCVVERSNQQSDKHKTTNAPNGPLHQRFALLEDILAVAASTHTRDPARFRQNQPKVERKTK